MPLAEFSPLGLYDRYRVTIQIRTKICGGTPHNAEVLESAIRARTGFDDHITAEQIAAAKAALPKTELHEDLVDEKVERSWNGFPLDESGGGLFIWARQIKAMFKESATMLKYTVEKRGSKQIFQHGFEIKGVQNEERIFLGVQAPSGFDEGPIHVQTPMGPRTAIKRVDYVERPTLTFEVWVLATHAAETRHIGERELRRMLTFAQENGLGADRSQGRGKFDVTAFEVINKAELEAAPKKEEKEKKKPTRQAESTNSA